MTWARAAKYSGMVAALVAATAALITHSDTIGAFVQPSVDGGWCITNTLENSSVERFKGLRLTYHVFLTKRGPTISGTGEKVLENGVMVGVAARSLIQLNGTMGGRHIVARYDLDPASDRAARKTTGEFRWAATADSILFGRITKLEGTFSGTGGSSGLSVGRPSASHTCENAI